MYQDVDLDAEFTTTRVLEIASSTPFRLRGVRMVTHSWIDPGGHEEASLRNAGRLVEFGEQRRSVKPASAVVHEDFCSLWYRYPNVARTAWSDNRAEVPALSGPEPDGAHRMSNVVPMQTGPASGATSVAIAPCVDDELPDFCYLFHPLVGELLEPATILQELDFEVLAVEQHMGRQVLRMHGVTAWRGSQSGMCENLAPADGYELLLDVESGILLRVACLLGGSEFSGQEVLDFDVELF